MCLLLLQQRRLHDLGKKHRVSLERNRLFHDKNMQLNSCNRRLEERVKQLLEDNAALVKITFNYTVFETLGSTGHTLAVCVITYWWEQQQEYSEMINPL